MVVTPILRVARREDCAAMSAIYNHYVEHDTCTYQTEPESLPERLAWFEGHGPAHPIFVAESEGRVVGWASLSPYNLRPGYRMTVEDSVYLDPTWRGRGLGTALLGKLIEAASACGHHTIIAVISAEQAPSVRLHQKFGFVSAGRLTQVGHKFGAWLDVVYLQLVLADAAPLPMPPPGG
jgi:L-amino acid N-acyltransferase YncA